jgi:hypothetical protein
LLPFWKKVTPKTFGRVLSWLSHKINDNAVKLVRCHACHPPAFLAQLVQFRLILFSAAVKVHVLTNDLIFVFHLSTRIWFLAEWVGALAINENGLI